MAHLHDERPRDHDSLRPGLDRHSGRRSREHSPLPPVRPTYAQDDRSHNPRHSYQHPPRPLTPQPPYASTGTLKRMSWPPSPFLEEEKTSLAREANPPRLADSDISDARSRGCLDQQPIILDALEGPSNRSYPSSTRTATPRRSHNGLRGQPPMNRRDKARGEQRRGEGPRSSQAFSETSTPSEYSTSGTLGRDKTAPVDSGYFSSPEARTRALADKRKAARGLQEVPMSDALRGKGKSRSSFDNYQRQPTHSGSEPGSDRGSSNISDAERVSVRPRPAEREFAQPYLKEASNDHRPRLNELKTDATHGTRRSSDSETTLPRPRLFEAGACKGATARPAPPPPLTPVITRMPIAAAAATAVAAIAGTDRGSGPRPGSPVSATTPRLLPKSSPSSRPGSYYGDMDLSPVTGRLSAPSSRPGSRSDSRPSSPNWAQPGLAFEAVRRSSTFPAVLEDRSQRTSRLVSSESASDSDSFHPPKLRTMATAPATGAAALPYPVDDTNLMPSEDDHRYKPRPLSSDVAPSISAHVMPSKPNLASRHSYDAEPPRLNTAATPVFVAARLQQTPTSSRSTTSRAPIRIEHCPRPHASRDHDDWYTFEKEPNFNMCPACYTTNFASGSFAKHCKRAPPKDPQVKIKCDFNSQWIRLAWLLTQEQRRYDLDLVYAVARVNAQVSRCPGDHSETQIWNNVQDRHGNAVEGFDVCSMDVKRIEALLPKLQGIFSNAYRGTAKKRKCDLRERSKRFPAYLDVLINLDERAYRKKTQPDVQRFAEFARKKCQVRECEEDAMLLDVAWHTAPQLPEFTVCEDCYVSTVWPAIEKGSAVASRFSRTPQIVYDKGNRQRGSPVGNASSCQLYSDRMQRVFKRTVETGDFAALAREALERKDVELKLHERIGVLKKQQTDLEKQGQSTAVIKAEMKRLVQEWRKVE